MNSLSDSIGTEMSYSDALLTESYKMNPTQDGGFLNLLFKGKSLPNLPEPSKQTQIGTEMTALILKAIDSSNSVAAAFILEQGYPLDMKYVDSNNNTLINALVKSRNNMQEDADKALAKLIPIAKDTLNIADSEGKTPFYNAVERKLHDLAYFMEKNGATRSTPSVTDCVMTDNDGIIHDATPSNSEQLFRSERAQVSDHAPVSGQLTKQIIDIIRAFETIPKNQYFDDNLTDTVTTLKSDTILRDSSDVFVNDALRDFIGRPVNPYNLKGGTSKNSKNSKLKVSGSRKIVRFSELSDNIVLSGGSDLDNTLRTIERASNNQIDKLHEDTVKKILIHLSDKDQKHATAIKEIIHKEIENKNNGLSKLDIITKTFNTITQKKVEDVLKQNDKIKVISKQLNKKSSDKKSSDKKSSDKK